MTTPSVLARLATTDAVVAVLATSELSFGGTDVSSERLNALMHTLGITPVPQVQRVAMPHAVRVTVYLLPPVLCTTLAAMQHEAVRDIAVAWSDSHAWQAIPIHPFDLAGFLIELQQLCRAAADQQHYVYLLRSRAADWQPQRRNGTH